MSKITNDGLTRSGTGCFIAVHMTTVGVKGLTPLTTWYSPTCSKLLYGAHNSCRSDWVSVTSDNCYMGLAKLWYCLSQASCELSNDSSIDSSNDSVIPCIGAPGMYRGRGLNKLGSPFQLSSSTSSADVDPHSVPSGLELRGVVPCDM